MHYHVNDLSTNVPHGPDSVSADMTAPEAAKFYEATVSRIRDTMDSLYRFDHTFIDDKECTPSAYFTYLGQDRGPGAMRSVYLERSHKSVDRCEFCRMYRRQRDRQNAAYEAAADERDRALAAGRY